MDLLNAMMIFFSILMVASIASLIADRSGDISFWINGSMIIGALLFSTIGSMFRNQNDFIFLSLLVSCVGTGLFTLIHAFITIKFKANFILSSTAINILASGIALFLVPILSKKLQNGSSSFSNPFVDIGIDIGGNYGITKQAIMWISIATILSILVFIYFKFTKIGMRHKTIGENPNAADAAGVNVVKYKFISLFVAGFLCGLAGSMSLTKMNVFIGNVQGMGFISLAITILGQWRIPLMVFSAGLFSSIWAFVEYNTSFAGIPKDILKMLPFLLSLCSLVFLSRFKSNPKAQGIHFNKTGGT